MSDYEKMYFTLFRAITDALNELTHLNIGNAIDILHKAQQTTERIYIHEES